MPLWIYNMPDWWLGLLMVGGCMGLGVGGHALRQRYHQRYRPRIDTRLNTQAGARHGDSIDTPSRLERTDRRLILGLLVVMGSLTTLLLALCATTGWEASSRVGLATQREAGAIGALGRSLSVIPQDESRLARERLKAYARAVVHKEWPAMRTSQSSLATWDAFDTLFRSLADIQPANASERALMPEVWFRVNELLRFRQARLDGQPSAVPAALWAVTVTSSGLTLGLLTLLPLTRPHRWAVGLAAGVLGLGLFLAASLDRPYGLSARSDPGPFEAAMRGMERWDSKVMPAMPP